MPAVRRKEPFRTGHRHNWSPEARQTIIDAVKIHRLLRREVAELYDGKLDGGQRLSLSAVTGILHRHDDETRQESQRKKESNGLSRSDSACDLATAGTSRHSILTLKHLRLVIPADPMPDKIYSDESLFAPANPDHSP